jgi:hypothetical protein
MGYDADAEERHWQEQRDEMDRHMTRFIAHHGQIQVMAVLMAYIAVVGIVLGTR